MSNTNLKPPPCAVCGSIEINAFGVCKACRRVRDRARWAEKHEEINARRRERYATIEEVKERLKSSSYAWRRSNPDKFREMQSRWFNADPARKERKHISEKLWRDRNVDRCKAKAKNNRAKDPEKFAAWGKAYRAANPQRQRAAVNAWGKLNPERRRIHKQTRRGRDAAVGASLSRDLVATLLLLQKGRCACCRKPLGKNFHLDHIVPIAKGGASVDWNMQLLRKRCNLSKGAKHPIDYMQERGFLL